MNMGEYGLKFAIYIFDDEHFYDLLYSDLGIKITMHMKEKGHKIPHVHIKYQDKEAVMNLIDGSFIEGNIKKSKLEFAKKFVMDNRKELIRRYKEIIVL